MHLISAGPDQLRFCYDGFLGKFSFDTAISNKSSSSDSDSDKLMYSPAALAIGDGVGVGGGWSDWQVFYMPFRVLFSEWKRFNCMIRARYVDAGADGSGPARQLEVQMIPACARQRQRMRGEAGGAYTDANLSPIEQWLHQSQPLQPQRPQVHQAMQAPQAPQQPLLGQPSSDMQVGGRVFRNLAPIFMREDRIVINQPPHHADGVCNVRSQMQMQVHSNMCRFDEGSLAWRTVRTGTMLFERAENGKVFS